MHTIRLSASAVEVARCYPVMRELRPHLNADEFADQVSRQEQAGYRLAYLEEGEVRSVAGFRILENLAWGKFFYVDDLVTRAADIGKGYGSALLDWLLNHAKEQGCEQFHLDSGVQRFDAHRFYLVKGMAITCHHFVLKLP